MIGAGSFFFFKNNFICFFWLHWILCCLHGPSLVVESGGYSLRLCGLLSVGSSFVVEHRIEVHRCQWLQDAGSVVVACGP